MTEMSTNDLGLAATATDGAQTPIGTETPGRSKASSLVLTDQTNLLPFQKVIVVFSSLSLCILVSTLDSTIVATALPSVAAAFNAGSIISWVPSAYLLISSAFQPLCKCRFYCKLRDTHNLLDGRFSDIFGRKATLCLAMGIFMLGSLLAGFAKSIIALIVFRGVAGAGGGGIVSIVQIVMSDVVSLRERYVTN